MAALDNLQYSVSLWMARNDLTEFIPYFIDNFESYMRRALVARELQTSATVTPVAGVATLPADYMTMRGVTWGSSPGAQLSYVTPDYFSAAYGADTSDTPSIYTIEGDNLKINSSSETDLRLSYVQKLPRLTGAAPTNWLIEQYPDLYLAGSLTEGFAFTQDIDAHLAWKARRDEAMREMFMLTFRGAIGPIQPIGATP